MVVAEAVGVAVEGEDDGAVQEAGESRSGQPERYEEGLITKNCRPSAWLAERVTN